MWRLSFFISIPFLAITASCNKTNESPCDLFIETNVVPCMANDTIESINGFRVIYYPDGTHIESEGNFVDGVRDGYWKFYYPDGTLRRDGNYTLGIADGFWNTFYPNGNAKTQGQFNDCERISFWKYYYEDFNYAVEYEGSYDKGKKTGTWKNYTIEGQLLATHDCN